MSLNSNRVLTWFHGMLPAIPKHIPMTTSYGKIRSTWSTGKNWTYYNVSFFS